MKLNHDFSITKSENKDKTAINFKKWGRIVNIQKRVGHATCLRGTQQGRRVLSNGKPALFPFLSLPAFRFFNLLLYYYYI